MVQDMFRSQSARSRPFINSDAVLANFERAGRFSRKIWGLISLELWHQCFHDRAAECARAPATKRGRMKVFITGGAGFIGSTLADRLLTRAIRSPSSTTTPPGGATTSPPVRA